MYLGDYSPASASTYAAWAAAVKRAGGIATALNSRPTAKYPRSVFAGKVTSGEWPPPGKITPDGQWAYYGASDAVARDALSLVVPTDAEAAAAKKKLLEQMGYPTAAVDIFKWIAAIGGGLAVVGFFAGAIGGRRR